MIETVEAKHNFLFLCTGIPLPAMLDMISYAKKSGLKPLLVLLDRGEKDLIIDTSSIDYEVLRIAVGYKSLELKRFLSLFGLMLKIEKVILRNLKSGGIIVTASLDMLFFARLATVFRVYKIRHQVRDLHSLQLGEGVTSSVLKLFERILLLRVEKIIVSSPKFATDYYQNLYSGEVVLLENVPRKAVWNGFKRRSRGNNEFVIGYVGILRYKDSLYMLIDTVEKLVKEGLNIKVVFAGGGMGSDLADIQGRIKVRGVFEFSGPYEYSKDIKRLYQDLDLIYAVYDEYDRNCQIAMPNKFYEAIISRIPLLVAANTFVGEQTLKLNIGEVVSLSNRSDLYDLLRAVTQPDSWYENASDALRKICPDSLYIEYEKSLAKSVLP